MTRFSTDAHLGPLQRLRARLTVWYAATFGVVLISLGLGLFFVIRHQLSDQLDESLVAATREIADAARIREMETANARGPVVDAIDELHIPDRALFLLDTSGNPVRPAQAPDWVRTAARATSATGAFDYQQEEEKEGHTLRAHARRFRLQSGRPLVAVATADDVELEDRYAELIGAFGTAAVLGLVLMALGGWLLVRQSTLPVERNVKRMRQFMADAAHELRTPLTVVRVRAEVALQQHRSSEEYAGALRSIEREAGRLGGIVENLLLLARADGGDLPLRRDLFYLDDVALDATRAALPVAQSKGIDLSLPAFDEAPVLGDATLVRQLIMILLDNALKFTPARGSVTVRVYDTSTGAELTVSDTGPGIAREHLPRVFERFFRGDAARSRSDGAGLGLSIARWIVDEHGGVIEVTSLEGAGTRVTVRFPPRPPNGAKELLVAQRGDGIELGRAPRGPHAEHDSHGGGEDEGEPHR